MEKNYGKWLIVLLVVANIISIEIPVEKLENAWGAVRGNFLGNDKEKVEKLLEEAQRLYDAENFDKLLEICDAIIQIDPENAVAYNLRGISHSKLKQYDQALQDYNKAIKLNPTNDDSNNNMRDLYKILKEYEQTLFDEAQNLYNAENFGKLLELCDAMIQFDPDNAFIYNMRGVAHSKLKEYEQAREDFDKAIELYPNYSEAYSNRGYLCKILKDYSQSFEDLKLAIKLDPNNPIAYMNLGEMSYEIENYEAAIIFLDKSIRIGLEGKDLGEALYYRGLSHLKQNDKEQAQSDLTKAKELGYPD